MKTVGALLGREKEAEAFITRYKQKAEEAKAKLQEVIGPDETVGTYSIWAKNFWVWPKTRDAGYNLYEMFGLKPLDKIEKEVFPTTGADISLEVLPEYAADHMFVTVYEPDGGAERAQEVMNGSIWKNLPAVKNNHVYKLDNKEFWMVDGLNLEKQAGYSRQFGRKPKSEITASVCLHKKAAPSLGLMEAAFWCAVRMAEETGGCRMLRRILRDVAGCC